MNETISKDNKINKFLKKAIIVQFLVLLVLAFLLIFKYINYSSSGNTITDSQPFAKCDFAYNCTCKNFSSKCDCIYYYKNEEPEKIKCNYSPELVDSK